MSRARGPIRIALLAAAVLSLSSTSAPASRSSYSPAGHGSKVFYLLLQDLGYQPQRAFDLREVDPATQLLVVIGLPESTQEGARWLNWARPGKTLLVAPPLEEEGGYCRNYKLGSVEIARTANALGFLVQEVPHPDLKLRSSACVLKAPLSATVLAGRPDQALAFEHPAGSGRLLVLAHEDLLVNDNLDRDDMVVLLRRRLATYLSFGARVTFLEERQGGQLIDLVKRSNLTAFTLHGLIWLLLLYWALAPRFGDAFPPLSSTRRAFAQHARALGALYRHRGASAYMLRHQFERFLGRLVGRGGRARSPMHTSEPRAAKQGPQRAALAGMVATRTGRDLDAVESLLAQLDKAMQDTGSSDPKQIQRHFRLSQSLAALSRVSASRAPGGSRARKGRSSIR